MHERKVRSLREALLVGGVLLYALVLIVAPIVALVQGAFKEGIETLIRAVTTPDALAALRLTAFLAVSAAMINAVFGLICAWVLVRHQFPGKKTLNAMVDMPFVVSPVIVGYVMIVLFGRLGWFKDFPIQLAFSVPGMLVVTVFVSLPFVIREVQPTLAALTREQEEAAYTLGASPWMVFRRVVFPAIRHALTYGVILTLARALGEFGAIAVIGGGVRGVTETATIYVYRTMHDRNPIAAYGMAVLLGLIAVSILGIMNWLRSGKRGH
jgi:sulfate/thiosulfate transport system permease protein